MQKVREGERESDFSPHQSKSGRKEMRLVVHKRNGVGGALGHQSDSALPVSQLFKRPKRKELALLNML